MSKKEKGKTDPQVKAQARFENINGVIVMVAPLDEPEVTTEESLEVLVDNRNGIISVHTEETFLEEEVQYVFDEASAEKSKVLAEKVRQENQERAAAASKEITIARAGDVIVVGSDTYDDINEILLRADKKSDAN
jgi:NCAIR mutase (PurE)-related protein